MLQLIWERYFLRQFFGLFFLFLFCFYGLYVLIDYASHTSALSQHHVQIHAGEIFRYYLYVFASRAEILLPLALLIAFVKTVCNLNSNQELVALMAGGFKLKHLMRPFLFVGFVCLLLMYANEQFLLPEALKKLRRLEDASKHQKHRHSPDLFVHPLILEDGSLFIYQAYDHSTERFFDAFWIQSIDSIYRIKYLSPNVEVAKGFFVDHLIRQPNGVLFHEAAYQTLDFPLIKFNPEVLQSAILDPDLLSISELLQEASQLSPESNEKDSKILTALYWKLLMPLLCLIAIIAPAPYCVRFSRHLPIFLIYMCSLFGLITFYMFMDAAQVVAKRQVIAPLWAIGSPFLILSGIFGWRYYKME